MRVVAHGTDAAKALREIGKETARWQASIHAGLAVCVRDGDEKEGREGKERKAWLRERRRKPPLLRQPNAKQQAVRTMARSVLTTRSTDVLMTRSGPACPAFRGRVFG